jgi:rifampicin phosphotransferase
MILLPRWRRRPLHLPRLATRDDFAAFAARYGHQTTARTEAVKFVIDRLDGNRIYFFDSNAFLTHYRFVQRYIDARLDHELFLRREYTHPKRRFLLGVLMHYLDGEHWTLELASNDTMDSAMLVWTFERIVSGTPFCSALRFRPLSPQQIGVAAAAGANLPVLPGEAINASVVYQPIVVGVAFGRLKRLRGAFDVADVRPYDVVVTDDVPNEIPPVAGLVTSQLQAPLSHVAVLCRGRNTPDMAHRGAIDLADVVRLEGEIVRLSVGAQEFSITRADRAEAAWAQMRPTASFTPECDASVHALQEIALLADDSAHQVGAKAAQLAALARIEGLVTPGGFAVPFAAYLAHIASAGIADRIPAMLSDPEFMRSPAVRAAQLAELRDRIQTHPLDAPLLAQVMERVRALPASQGWIVRSSSNAEDLAGFSGAGLYESCAVPAPVDPGSVADAMRLVWASVWLPRAFEEREWYRIDHRSVAMGLVVQPSVDDAIASGVAITGNPFKPAPGLLINVQISGHTVTGAAGDELPEQYLVTTWTGVYEFELLSKSSLSNGALILDETDLQRLCDQLMAIHERLLPRAQGRANAMDVEFILTRQREFVIVQARPYTIAYNLDRADPEEGGQWMRVVRRIVARFVPNRLAYRPPDE